MMTYDTKKLHTHHDPGFLCPVGAEERDLRHTLIQTLDCFFIAIVRVNLREDTVTVMQSVDEPQLLNQKLLWSAHLKYYGDALGTGELDFFSAENMLAHLDAGQSLLEKDISYIKNNSREWLTVTALLSAEADGTPYAMVLMRESSGEHMLREIIDLYVYNSCDYFICLNARDNSYISLSRSQNGTPLPPDICSDYTSEVVTYAKAFVVPEDQERVIYEMGISRILEELENKPCHTFTCGINDPVRGYTRKQLTYQYYDRNAQMILLARTDITEAYLELARYQEEIRNARQEARTDPLTGLHNLQGTVECITAWLQEEGEKAALLFIDLDDFKIVNDTLGHSAGDRLLQEIAKILLAHVRKSDLVGRIGGDEFLIYMRNATSVEIVTERATQLHEAISALSHTIGISVSCSVGIAFAPADGMDYTTLTKCADYRTYQAKNRGKNQYSID